MIKIFKYSRVLNQIFDSNNKNPYFASQVASRKKSEKLIKNIK